jgi:hypothetical protein
VAFPIPGPAGPGGDADDGRAGRPRSGPGPARRRCFKPKKSGLAAGPVTAAVAAFVLLVLGATGGYHLWKSRGAAVAGRGRAPVVVATSVGTGVGQQAPEIEGEDIDGVRFKLSDYRGQVVVLDFWGHW